MDNGLNIDTRYGYLGLALAINTRPQRAHQILADFLERCRRADQAPTQIAEHLAKAAQLEIDWTLCERHLKWEQARPEHHIVLPYGAEFPPLLKELPDCPSALFVCGQKDKLCAPQVAMVGSRKASQHGLANARDLARLLLASGYQLTSGLAIGIDAECHQTAVSSEPGTLAVLGCGVDVCYPRRHRSLRQEIAENGALVSEFPLGSQPKPYHFPRRNRIISGLSVATIVVEASPKSGSLTTARHAADQGREVYAVPGSIRYAGSAGCNELIADGAQIIFNSAALLASLRQTCKTYFPDFEVPEIGLSRAPGIVGQHANAVQARGPGEQRVLSLIGQQALSFDELVTLSGLTSSELSSILSALEVDGLIHAEAGNAYTLA